MGAALLLTWALHASIWNRVESRLLSDSQIQEFTKNGVLVVPDILSAGQVASARAGLESSLRRAGIHSAKWNQSGIGGPPGLRQLQLTGGKGGIIDIYYDSWAMELRLNSRIFEAMQDLWAAT